jgi:hypothetical protein
MVLGSNDFELSTNTLMWFYVKTTSRNIAYQLFLAKCSNSSWSVFDQYENTIEVLLLLC